ncbi:MAG TPA: ribbon-helix-helix domain-containing protein [Nitrospirae bacterium]|nr:ribbon-helix-helix domain-containing protein [Nitrospirota bacterium]
MKRTTIFIDEEIYYDIKELAEEDQKAISEILREALVRYLKERKKKKKLSIIGIAESGRKDIAERHEEILWQEAKNRKGNS